MTQPVELSVRSSLTKVIDELTAIRESADRTTAALKTAGQATGSALAGAAKKAKLVGEAFQEAGDGIEEGLNRNVKRTESFFVSLRSLSRRVADQLRGDFKSLLSINAVSDSLKLSNQFRGSIAETVELSDSIRKLGATFGIAGKDFAKFQADMTSGLGEIGMASDVGARVLNGLSTSRVRGQDNLVGYSKTAGMLASVGQEKGQEGAIARELAAVIQARGGNVNDRSQVEALAEAVRRVFVETGASPSQTLKTMEEMFAKMPEDFRKAIGPQGLSSLATASAVGGPNATKFLEDYLGQSKIDRMAFDAQGGKGIFTDKGLDVEKFRKFYQSIVGRVGGDPRKAASTLGLSPEASEGFIRLGENLDKVKDAQERVTKSTGDLSAQYRASMGFAESFRANINRVKSALASPLAKATQGATDFLSGTAQSNGGAGAVVAGGGLLAMLLAGLGLKGIGKGIGGTLGGLAGTAIKGAAAEGITGKEAIPVFVVNAAEIGGGGAGGLLGDAAGGAAGGAAAAGGMGILGKMGSVAGAGVAGYAIGSLLSGLLKEHTQGKTAEGYEGDAGDRLIFKLAKMLGADGTQDYEDHSDARIITPSSEWKPQLNMPEKSGGRPIAAPQQTVKVIVETNPKDLKYSKQPTRGASN